MTIWQEHFASLFKQFLNADYWELRIYCFLLAAETVWWRKIQTAVRFFFIDEKQLT